MKNKHKTATFLRHLALTLMVAMLTASAAWAQNLSGSGTESDPYLIETTTDLDLLATNVNNGNAYEGKYFKLGADITYSYADLEETGSNFTAIGNWNNQFKGNFDGDGKTISGIRIYKPNDVQGLFGCISNANVENIILTDAKITGDIVGGIAGACNESTIRNCIVDNVFVNGASQECGGIAGEAYWCTLVGNLVVNSTITVANPNQYIYTGAITGDSDGSLENNYYYNCKVIVGETEKNTDVGCGQNVTLPHDIDGARQAVQISATEGISFQITSNNALAYENQIYVGVGATVTLAITDIYKPDEEGYTVSGYTYAEGKSLTKNADGNYTFTVPSYDVTISRVITDVWNVENGADGSADLPYIITTPAGLDLLATKVNNDPWYQKHFELGADIDYKDVPKDESGSNFTPIGKDRSYSFKGSFDGKGYTISGIVLNRENASFQGLFGYVGWSDDYSDNGPIVKNVILASSTIKGYELVGGIAGGSAGMISNCTVKSDVKIYAQACGGILEFNNGFVENCTSSAQLEGKGNSNVGGIAGESWRHGLANNRAIGVKISGTFSKAGAITPYTSNEDSLHNNFYLNCMVLDNTAGIGYNGEDFTKNNGAVSVYAITLCDGITITPDPSITYNETSYYAQGTVLDLSCAEGKRFFANGEEISAETFTMPAKDVTFTREYSITYNLNGGTLPEGTANPITYTVESDEITLATPTYNYGTFGGWYNNRTFDGEPIATINSAEAKDINLYAKWDIVSITEIKTTNDLIYFANTVKAGNTYEGKTVTLMNDIDFEPTAETTENFDGIGQPSRPFSGTFDGGNHTISGIRINKPNGDKYGLFCVLRGAVVKNIVLDNAQIICKSNNGGIAGEFNGGTIIGCTITDKVTIISTQQGNNLGGIVGGFNGTISDCISKATITANEGSCWGGIAGQMESGTISHCTSYATIKVNQSSIGGFGGIVGFNASGTVEDNLVIDATITFNTASGAIAGFNSGTLKNNFYYNTTVNGATTNIGCNSKDITENNGAVHLDVLPDLIIDGDSESPVAITETQTGANVLYLRKLTAGVTSTIILPFAFDASSMPGTFYHLTSVNTDDWTAGANKVTGALSANTPYLFLPNADIDKTVFTDVTLTPTTGDNTEIINDNWTFHGVYEKILWETAPKNHYGFSAVANGDNIAAGDFVKIGQYVRIKPTRAYLTYDDGISKSSIVLPDRIHVVFSDEEIASVIDLIDTPTDDPTEDITTPVSELPAQASNVKVWSYEKTIYIQAAPMTDYRIIDATGRVLRSATTQTNRDEIRLGNLSGIVIVIINNKTYKINY